jgi:hypothetical protein
MKSEMAALAYGLSLMPITTNGQSPIAEVVGPTGHRVAEPMFWRDGYITWRARKISEPDWQMFKADNGATFAIDKKSIMNISPNGLVVSAVAYYFIEGDDFNPNNLISFAFDCKDFTEVVTTASQERVQLVEKHVRALARH